MVEKKVLKAYIRYGLPRGTEELDDHFAVAGPITGFVAETLFPPVIEDNIIFEDHQIRVDLVNDAVEWDGKKYHGPHAVRNALWVMRAKNMREPLIPLDKVRITDDAIVWGPHVISPWYNLMEEDLRKAIDYMKHGWSVSLKPSGEFFLARIVEKRSNFRKYRVKGFEETASFYRGLPLGKNVEYNDFEVEPFKDRAKSGMPILGEVVRSNQFTHVITNVGLIRGADRDSEEYEVLLEYAVPGFEVEFSEEGVLLEKRLGAYTITVYPGDNVSIIYDFFGNPVLKGEATDAYKLRSEKQIWRLLM